MAAKAPFKRGPAKKPEKIRLSKEQKQRVGEMISLENRITICREYIKLWMEFFQFFADDIQKRQISDQEEKLFFQTLTILARKHFLFCELMGDTYEAHERIMDVLIASVSLANLKGLNEAMLSKLELDWHGTLIDMNVGLGRLLRLLPAGTRIDDALAQADKMAAGSATLTGRPAPPPVKPARPEAKSGVMSKFFAKSGK